MSSAGTGIENDAQAFMCSGQDQVHAQDNWCALTVRQAKFVTCSSGSHMAEVVQFSSADDNHAVVTHPSFTVVHFAHHVLGFANLREPACQKARTIAVLTQHG